MLEITLQLDILVILTSQITTIICHHIKKNIIKKKNMEELDQITKTIPT